MGRRGKVIHRRFGDRRSRASGLPSELVTLLDIERKKRMWRRYLPLWGGAVAVGLVIGIGPTAQRAAVQEYVRQSQGELLAEYVEIETGSGKARPVLVQSIAQCRKQKATLLIAKLDRLARNVAFVSSLMEGGVEFLAVDAPYANRLMIHILAAFAEHERTLISERTKAALAAAKDRGVQLGTHGSVLASYNKREAHEFAETLRSDVDLALANGALTLDELSAALNSAGRTTREGRPWRPSTTSRLVRRLKAGEPPTQSN